MTIVIALHGFLGLGADYSFLESSLSERFKKSEVGVWAPNLFEEKNPWAPSGSMQEWAKDFNEYIKQEFTGVDKILVGYSLGGRLAMQSLLADPELWQASLLISSNLLTISLEERQSREYWDNKWADKFRNDPWDGVVKEWDTLPIFATSRSQSPIRYEEDFDREGLARALELWSPVKQSTLSSDQLNRFQNSHFVVGLKDQKYLAIQERMAEITENIRMWQIDGGHRLLLDGQEWVAGKVKDLVVQKTFGD